jgi:hypothetical protein
MTWQSLFCSQARLTASHSFTTPPLPCFPSPSPPTPPTCPPHTTHSSALLPLPLPLPLHHPLTLHTTHYPPEYKLESVMMWESCWRRFEEKHGQVGVLERKPAPDGRVSAVTGRSMAPASQHTVADCCLPSSIGVVSHVCFLCVMGG